MYTFILSASTSTMNSSNFSIGEESHLQRGAMILLHISGSFVVSFAFTANFLVLLVLIIKKNLRKETYTVLVICLSAADFVNSATVLLKLVSRLISSDPVHFCRVWVVLLAQGVFMSVYFTLIISLNRYASAINAAWKNRLFRGRRKYALLFVPSGIVAIVNFIFGVVWDIKSPSCNRKSTLDKNTFIFYIYATILNFPVFLFAFVLYGLALQSVHKRFGQVLPQTTVVRVKSATEEVIATTSSKGTFTTTTPGSGKVTAGTTSSRPLTAATSAKETLITKNTGIKRSDKRNNTASARNSDGHKTRVQRINE